MNDHIHLRKQDIYGAYWKAGKLTIHTKNGGLVFGCPREQWQASQALKAVGFNVAEPPLTKAQKYLKSLHHLVNQQFFNGMLSTPYFVFAHSPSGYEAWYNATRHEIGFNPLSYKSGFDNVGRWAFHTMLHECIHQYVDDYCGVRPVKGLDSHLEQTFKDTASLMLIMLGLPLKTDFTLTELKAYPQSLIHSSYYEYRTDNISPSYDWR